MSLSLSRLNSVIPQCIRAESAMSTFGRYGRTVGVPHTLVPGLWIQVLDAVERLTRRWNLAWRSSLLTTSPDFGPLALVGPVWPLALRVMPIVRSSICWSVLEGMGCLTPRRRYLGDVAFWRKSDTFPTRSFHNERLRVASRGRGGGRQARLVAGSGIS
jgi:hypothetical protein